MKIPEIENMSKYQSKDFNAAYSPKKSFVYNVRFVIKKMCVHVKDYLWYRFKFQRTIFMEIDITLMRVSTSESVKWNICESFQVKENSALKEYLWVEYHFNLICFGYWFTGNCFDTGLQVNGGVVPPPKHQSRLVKLQMQNLALFDLYTWPDFFDEF